MVFGDVRFSDGFCCKTLFRLAAGLVREPLSVLPLRELRHPRLTDA